MSKPDLLRTIITSEVPSESIVPVNSPEIEEAIYSEDDTANAEQEVLQSAQVEKRDMRP